MYDIDDDGLEYEHDDNVTFVPDCPAPMWKIIFLSRKSEIGINIFENYICFTALGWILFLQIHYLNSLTCWWFLKEFLLMCWVIKLFITSFLSFIFYYSQNFSPNSPVIKLLFYLYRAVGWMVQQTDWRSVTFCSKLFCVMFKVKIGL